MSSIVTTFLAGIATITLWIIAAVHVYWAFGGVWPASERSTLPQTVVGSEDERMPPMGITLVVAVLIAGAGTLPLVWFLVWSGTLVLPVDQKFLTLALWGLVAVFLVRGIVTYTPLVGSVFVVEPFKTLNIKYYSPLCIALGCIFLALALTDLS